MKKFLTHYCSCGACFKVTNYTPDEKKLADELFSIWKKEHSGIGHQKTTANESNLARNNWTTRYYR